MIFTKKLIFLYLPLIIYLVTAGSYVQEEAEQSDTYYTVSGSISADHLGFTLVHEHIMSNFGKTIENTSEYDEDALLKQVIPYLKKIKSLGVDTIFDCTTAYFGRRVDLLQEISDETGVQIVTNTGFYGAVNDRYIPQIAYGSTPKEISKIWIDEFHNGIDGTDIRPGFIKLAFDSGSPSKIDQKLFEAGVHTHLQTGLPLAVHTGNNPEAVALQLKLLDQYGVSPDAWIWTHAHTSDDIDLLLKTAQKGAWISLDRVDRSTIPNTVEWLQQFRSENLLHKILISHDGNGFPAGGEIRPFEAVMNELIPSLVENSFTESEIDQLFIDNPKEAFSIRIRKLN